MIDPKLREVIETLKKVDEEIDLARGSVQLNILILSAKAREISAYVASKELGIPIKTATDAIQKLKRKGLLKKVKHQIYTLSDRGWTLYRILETLAKSAIIVDRVRHLRYMLLLSEIILLIGTSLSEWVSVNRLARELRSDENLILRIVREEGYGIVKIRKGPVNWELALTYDGKRVYSELLDNLGLGSLAAKTFSLLTYTLHPGRALKRFMIIYLLVTILVALELTSPIGIIAGSAWIVASLYLAFLLYSKA